MLPYPALAFAFALGLAPLHYDIVGYSMTPACPQLNQSSAQRAECEPPLRSNKEAGHSHHTPRAFPTLSPSRVIEFRPSPDTLLRLRYLHSHCLHSRPTFFATKAIRCAVFHAVTACCPPWELAQSAEFDGSLAHRKDTGSALLL